jgi:hypothetical protein
MFITLIRSLENKKKKEEEERRRRRRRRRRSQEESETNEDKQTNDWHGIRAREQGRRRKVALIFKRFGLALLFLKTIVFFFFG